MDDIVLLDKMYGQGALSLFEWFDFKDRYTMPKQQTDRYFRTCLYPVFGKKSYHLGKFELYYAFHSMLNGWKTVISNLRKVIEKREKEERTTKIRQEMAERFMRW
jgi:hypothetical protein